MPPERFRDFFLELCEMVCQHVVKKTGDSHLVATDYMKHLLYAVVVLLADIHLFSEPCGDVGFAYECAVIIGFLRLSIPAPAFRFPLGRDAGGGMTFRIPSSGDGA